VVILIDNYDSFAYNLYQYLTELGAQVSVHRNDRISVAEALDAEPQAIVISPGPGRPDDAGISCNLIAEAAGKVPVLGVSLGHLCIGQVFGAQIVRASQLMHGKASEIIHDGRHLYEDMPDSFTAMRYHSLVIEPESVPESLEITARTAMGEVMGIRHRQHLLEGVQFHPESIMTEYGKRLIANFLAMTQITGSCHA
jgi:anthranilate synthase/aminodeoxychorismate synthase-like glutamine amidotransferase